MNSDARTKFVPSTFGVARDSDRRLAAAAEAIRFAVEQFLAIRTSSFLERVDKVIEQRAFAAPDFVRGWHIASFCGEQSVAFGVNRTLSKTHRV
jgi:hypothetical protein